MLLLLSIPVELGGPVGVCECVQTPEVSVAAVTPASGDAAAAAAAGSARENFVILVLLEAAAVCVMTNCSRRPNETTAMINFLVMLLLLNFW